MRRTTFTIVGGMALCAAAVFVPPAGADPIGTGSASAYGALIDITDQNVITEPDVSSTLAEDDVSETVVDVPADPLAVSGTLTASAAVHVQSDLPSELLVESQAVEGPYNARGFAEIEGAEVLLDAVEEDVSLLQANAVRAEAVAVCTGDQVQYSAESEIVNLVIGGEEIPLNAPAEDLIDAINGVLVDSGLAEVVNVERNVLTVDANGASVDALRVTVLAAAGETPVGTVVLGHAEVDSVSCGEPPECSDTADNDGDGVIDADDPGCHTDGDPNNPDSYDPNDDDETDDDRPECSDTADNDGDGVVDAQDPGCHTDGDATNPDSYDPNDDDETDPGAGTSSLGRAAPPPAQLARTGSDATVGVAAALALAAGGLVALRRLRTTG